MTRYLHTEPSMGVGLHFVMVSTADPAEHKSAWQTVLTHRWRCMQMPCRDDYMGLVSYSVFHKAPFVLERAHLDWIIWNRNNNNNGCFVVVAVPLTEGATVCLFLALKSGIADNICFGSLSKKDSLRTADVCQYLFELSELKIAPSGRRKIQLQILASKPNSYIALLLKLENQKSKLGYPVVDSDHIENSVDWHIERNKYIWLYVQSFRQHILKSFWSLCW